MYIGKKKKKYMRVIEAECTDINKKLAEKAGAFKKAVTKREQIKVEKKNRLRNRITSTSISSNEAGLLDSLFKKISC